MKSFFISTVLFFLVAETSFAQEKAVSSSVSKTTLIGYLTDVKCGQGFKTDDDAKGHTKSCALMPGCAKSGYALFIDGKLIKFDESGNKKAKKYLKALKDENNLKVEVSGKMNGEFLVVSEIKEVK